MDFQFFILQVGMLQKSPALRAKSSSVVVVNVQRDKVHVGMVLYITNSFRQCIIIVDT